MAANEGGKPGVGVDYSGRDVVDPTKNVLDLVAAAIQRQDDLRAAETRRIDDLAKLRVEYESIIQGLRSNSLMLVASQLKENKQDASERIAKLEQFRYESSGTGGGRKEMVAWFIAAVAAIASIASIGGVIIAYMKYSP